MSSAESDPGVDKHRGPKRIIGTTLALALTAGAGYGARAYQDYRNQKPLCYAESTYSPPNAKFRLAWLAAVLPNNKVITVEADEMNNQADLPEVQLWMANGYVSQSNDNPNGLRKLPVVMDDGRIHDITLPAPGLEQYVLKVTVDSGDNTIETRCELQPGIQG